MFDGFGHYFMALSCSNFGPLLNSFVQKQLPEHHSILGRGVNPPPRPDGRGVPRGWDSWAGGAWAGGAPDEEGAGRLWAGGWAQGGGVPRSRHPWAGGARAGGAPKAEDTMGGGESNRNNIISKRDSLYWVMKQQQQQCHLRHAFRKVKSHQ